jgi:hypothetical protein
MLLFQYRGGGMKTLISGIVGAAVAAVAWMALEHVTHKDFGWLALVVGLVTGVAVHWGAGAHARESFARGALAVLLTLTACVGGRMLYVAYVRSVSQQVTTHVAQVAKQLEQEARQDADDAEASAEAPPPADSRERDDRPRVKLQRPTLKQPITQWDMLWLCLAALVAYVTGKGVDRQPPPTEPAATDAQPPAAT